MKAKGFTLIELMVVIAILSVLAAIAFPVTASLIRKSQEASTKGNLGSLRSALAIYFGDTEGAGLVDLSALTWGCKYLNRIPVAYYPTHHSPGNRIGAGNETQYMLSATEASDWWLFTDYGRQDRVIANCIHTDVRGQIWTVY